MDQEVALARPIHGGTLAGVPVLHSTKWVHHPQALNAKISRASDGAVTAQINLSHVGMQHRVESAWVEQLAALLLDGPGQHRAAQQSDKAHLRHEVRVTARKAIVQYCPKVAASAEGKEALEEVHDPNAAARSSSSVEGSGECDAYAYPPAGVEGCREANTEADGSEGVDEGDATTSACLGRAVIVAGVVRLSGSWVHGEPPLAGKCVVGDAVLYISQDGKELTQPESAPDCQTPGVFSLTVEDYLEHAGMVHVATLDFCDCNVTGQSCPASEPPRYWGETPPDEPEITVPEPLASEPKISLEMWMGLLHLYTCRDSLRTLLGLASHWWDTFQDITLAAELAKAKHRQALHEATKGSKASSGLNLLAHMDDACFSAPAPETGGGLLLGVRDEGELEEESSGGLNEVVIREDYYIAGQKPAGAGAEVTGEVAPVVAEAKRAEGSGNAPDLAARVAGQKSKEVVMPKLEEPAARWLASAHGPEDAGGWLGAGELQAVSGRSEEGSCSDESEDGSCGVTSQRKVLGLGLGLGSFMLPAPVDLEMQELPAAQPLVDEELGAAWGWSSGECAASQVGPVPVRADMLSGTEANEPGVSDEEGGAVKGPAVMMEREVTGNSAPAKEPEELKPTSASTESAQEEWRDEGGPPDERGLPISDEREHCRTDGGE
ncbi:unnamed protein product, partial [Chrysoparadoxa australica]